MLCVDFMSSKITANSCFHTLARQHAKIEPLMTSSASHGGNSTTMNPSIVRFASPTPAALQLVRGINFALQLIASQAMMLQASK